MGLWADSVVQHLLLEILVRTVKQQEGSKAHKSKQNDLFLGWLDAEAGRAVTLSGSLATYCVNPQL